MNTKSKTQQRLFGKLNISDNLLLDTSVISPKKQYGLSTPDNSITKANNENKENFLRRMNKVFSTTSRQKKKIQGANPYQNFKIDLLVSNNAPLKNQISTVNYYKDKNSKDNLVPNFQKSTKDFIIEKGSNTIHSKISSHLDNLSNSMKLANSTFNPVEKAQKNKDFQALGKKFNFKFLATITTKKENLMNLLIDKRTNISNQLSVVNGINTVKSNSLLNETRGLPGTKRELKLLSTRLNKLFPESKKK